MGELIYVESVECAQRREFGFTADWREELPFWMILPRTILFVGVPAWAIWVLVVYVHYWGIYALFILGMLALAGGRSTVVYAERVLNFRRRLQEECIVVDTDGLRLLPPTGKWRTFPWREVTEIRNTTVGGLFPESFTTVEAGGLLCPIPAWVNHRNELLRLIRLNANLSRTDDGWWTTVHRRP